MSLTAAVVTTGLAAQESVWKDRAEYDLVQAINATTDAKKKVEMLNQWKEKYPDSKLAWDRLGAIVTACQAAADAPCMKKTALEMIQTKPKEWVGYYYVNILSLSMQDTSAAALADAEKAATGFLELIPSIAKQPNQTDAQLEASKKQYTALSHKVLGWAKMNKNDHTGAEASFLESLKVEPSDAVVSFWTGTVVQRQKDQAKQAQIVWHYCRAGHMTGPGALPQPDPVKNNCKKFYSTLRGGDNGVNEFIERSLKSPIPPAGLEIEDMEAEQIRLENKMKESNPKGFIWLTTKKQLVGAEGEKYFEAEMKGTLLEDFKGKIISLKPEEKPTEIVVSIIEDGKVDATLLLNGPLPGKADVGTEITFSGVPVKFVKDPFNVMIEVEREKIGGWPDKSPMPPITAPRKSVAPVKKGVAPVKRPAVVPKKK
jgi:hypothetical protein